MWKKIYRHLKSKGFEVFSPGQHVGECTKPFIVLRNGGEIGKDTHATAIMDVMIYYPKNQYSSLEDYRLTVKEALSELSYLRKTGQETPVIYEEEKKAHSFSIEYILMKA